MSVDTTQRENGIEQEDVAIDVPANDLVLIGRDDRGHNHYYDARRDRVLVVDAEHEEYTPEGSIQVRRRLITGAAHVEHVQTDGETRDLKHYVRFVDEAVDDREWALIAVTTISADPFDVIGTGARR